MKLFITPVDVWLFRDGRPFDAGADHRAVGLFPPYPSVMQGVLRSHHLVVRGVDLGDPAAIEAAVGTATQYGSFRMKGPFVARQEGGRVVRYFPVPADATEQEGRVLPLQPVDVAGRGVATSALTPRLLWPRGEVRKERGGGWLPEDRLLAYLRGEAVSPVAAGDLFRHESRLGIARDDRRRTTREGALYEVRYVRPCGGVGLEVAAEGLEGWPPEGLLRMGGEGRAGHFVPSSSADWPRPPDPLPARFKLYLATPACFRRGWRPAAWEPFFEGRVELVAAANGRFEAVGGFDLARGGQKPARRYVPAGSVYFFESDGRARVRPGLPNGAITEEGGEIGFGQFFIGRW